MKQLGLDPPSPKWYDNHPLIHLLRMPAYIPEGRAVFEALVPNRYKRNPDPPLDTPLPDPE